MTRTVNQLFAKSMIPAIVCAVASFAANAAPYFPTEMDQATLLLSLVLKCAAVMPRWVLESRRQQYRGTTAVELVLAALICIAVCGVPAIFSVKGGAAVVIGIHAATFPTLSALARSGIGNHSQNLKGRMTDEFDSRVDEEAGTQESGGKRTGLSSHNRHDILRGAVRCRISEHL